MRVEPEPPASSPEETASARTGAPTSPDPTGGASQNQNSTPGANAPLEPHNSHEEGSTGQRADAPARRADSRSRLLLPPLSVSSPHDHGRRLSTKGSEKKDLGTYSPHSSNNGRDSQGDRYPSVPLPQHHRRRQASSVARDSNPALPSARDTNTHTSPRAYGSYDIPADRPLHLTTRLPKQPEAQLGSTLRAALMEMVFEDAGNVSVIAQEEIKTNTIYKGEARTDSFDGLPNFSRMKILLCILGLHAPSRKWVVYSSILLAIGIIKSIALGYQGWQFSYHDFGSTSSLFWLSMTNSVLSQAALLFEFVHRDQLQRFFKLYGTVSTYQVMDAELGRLLWRSSFVIVPLVFYQCGSTLVTAFRNDAGSDFDRNILRLYSTPFPSGHAALIYPLQLFITTSQFFVSLFMFCFFFHTLNQRFAELDEHVKWGKIHVYDVWEAHENLCYLTKRTDQWFQKFSTIYLSFNLSLIIIIANLLLLSTVSTAAQLTAYSFLFLSVLCVSVFLYVSVSISDWHDRIASSLMERVRGSLLLSDEEGGTDEPVDFLMLLHRFERVQPGVTIFNGSVNLHWKVVVTSLSAVFSIFYFTVYLTKNQTSSDSGER